MISEHYPSFAIADNLKSRKHKPKFVDVYIILIPRLSWWLVSEILMITMHSLNRLWWIQCPNILPQRLLDLKSITISDSFYHLWYSAFHQISNLPESPIRYVLHSSQYPKSHLIDHHQGWCIHAKWHWYLWVSCTPLFKSNRNLFSSVKRWYIFSMYRFEIFPVAWGLLHSLRKISWVYGMAVRLCEHSNLVRFEKRAAKTLQHGYRYGDIFVLYDVITTYEWFFC